MRQDYAEFPNFSSQHAAILLHCGQIHKQTWKIPLKQETNPTNKFEKSSWKRRQIRHSNLKNPPTRGSGQLSELGIWQISLSNLLLLEQNLCPKHNLFSKKIPNRSKIFPLSHLLLFAQKFSIHIIIFAWPKSEGLKWLTTSPSQKNICAGVKTERSLISKRELPLRL